MAIKMAMELELAQYADTVAVDCDTGCLICVWNNQLNGVGDQDRED
jgi:hypothetical protein